MRNKASSSHVELSVGLAEVGAGSGVVVDDSAHAGTEVEDKTQMTQEDFCSADEAKVEQERIELVR